MLIFRREKLSESVKKLLKKLLKKTGLYDGARKLYHLFKRTDIKIIDNRMELEQMIQVGIMNQYKIIA